MKGVQCYELFGGIALKIHTFSFHFIRFSGQRSKKEGEVKKDMKKAG